MRRHRIFVFAFLALMALYCSSARAQEKSRSPASLQTSLPAPTDDYEYAVFAFQNGIEPKIVGGLKAVFGQYPWQASLDVSWIADPYRAHFCGGSIFSDRWIVTAAHCVLRRQARDIVVSVGMSALGVGGTRRNVNRIIVKSDYNRPKQHDNDIALIEIFGEPLPLSDPTLAVSAITLLANGEDEFTNGAGPEGARTGTWFEVTGWGAMKAGGQQVRDLRVVAVPYLSSGVLPGVDSCNRPFAYAGRVTDNMLCAGTRTKDSCQGDSGGPLVLGSGSSARLAGIVSWGEGCAAVGKVGVYTRVAKYEAWVRACTASPSSCP